MSVTGFAPVATQTATARAALPDEGGDTLEAGAPGVAATHDAHAHAAAGQQLCQSSVEHLDDSDEEGSTSAGVVVVAPENQPAGTEGPVAAPDTTLSSVSILSSVSSLALDDSLQIDVPVLLLLDVPETYRLAAVERRSRALSQEQCPTTPVSRGPPEIRHLPPEVPVVAPDRASELLLPAPPRSKWRLRRLTGRHRAMEDSDPERMAALPAPHPAADQLLAVQSIQRKSRALSSASRAARYHAELLAERAALLAARGGLPVRRVGLGSVGRATFSSVAELPLGGLSGNVCSASFCSGGGGGGGDGGGGGGGSGGGGGGGSGHGADPGEPQAVRPAAAPR